MKVLVFVVLAGWFAAQTCETAVYFVGGRTISCMTCCYGNGQCTTTCSEV